MLADRPRVLLGRAPCKVLRVATTDPELERVDHTLANRAVGDLEDEIGAGR